jgi:hypothetical protein
MNEKLVRDGYDWLPHRTAQPGERRHLLARKLAQELAEVNAAASQAETLDKLGDLVEACYALGGEDAVTRARLDKLASHGGYDRMIVLTEPE